MKAYNCNGILYASKDLAILCNGTNKIQEIEVPRGTKIVRGEVWIMTNRDQTIDFDLIVDPLYMTYHEGIAFKYDFQEWEGDFAETFEQECVKGDFVFTDLSDELQSKIIGLLRDWYNDWHAEHIKSLEDGFADSEYDAYRDGLI